MTKKIILIITGMNIGGAERVLSGIANYYVNNNWNTTVIITNNSLKDTNLSRLSDNVSVISIIDELENQKKHNTTSSIIMLQARVIGKLKPIFGQRATDNSSIRKYYSRNYEKISWLKKYLKKNSDATLVAFLYDSIFLTLLSRRKTNKVIISDRGDPQQSVSSRTDMAFFRRMFNKADEMIFQSPDVKEWYKNNIGLDGKVIFNPIKSNLPQPYKGERKHVIVNFCRISPQKNMFLLLESFEKLAEEYADYELHIYGEISESERDYGDRFLEAVNNSKYSERIKLFPGREDVHEVIKDAAMFASSSDFEGMSNSMLEAMAIGLPTICTDCPAGGARAVIKDHENGILVPVGDAEKLYLAMKEVIENPELAEKLSRNGAKIRETQSEEVIMAEWEKIINA